MAGVSEQSGRYERSFGGMVGALLVLLLLVGVFVVLRDLNRVDPVDPVQSVDYAQPARFARESAAFDVLAPRRLPAGWIATSVRFRDGETGSWHLGCLTGERRYVGLEQAQRPVSSMVSDFVDENARAGSEVRIDGQTWLAYADPGRDPGADPTTAPEGDLALVREETGATTLVVGTVSQDTLVEFVRSLR